MGLWVPGATAETPAAYGGFAYREAWVPSSGGVQLLAQVYRQPGLAPTARTPVILSVGPYFGGGGTVITGLTPTAQGDPAPFGTGDSLVRTGAVLARGYTYVQVSLRGFGASGGCADLGGRGEQADVRAAIDWAAAQPWSTGRVGLWGLSYAAATQVMALVDPPDALAAVVAEAPFIAGYRYAYTNGVKNVNGAEDAYPLSDLVPPGADAPPGHQVSAAGGTAASPRCYAEPAVAGYTQDREGDPYWAERDYLARHTGAPVPALWAFGFNDKNVFPHNALDLFHRFTGPKAAWFGQWEHASPAAGPDFVGRDGFLAQAIRLYDRHLKGVRVAEPEPAVVVQQSDGRWRAEREWPPPDSVDSRLQLLPGSFRESYDEHRDLDATTPLARAALSGPATGGRSWTLSQPLPYEVHLSGVPTVRIDAQVVGPTTCVVLLYDVAPDGTASFVQRGAAKLLSSGPTTFEMFPQDWVFRPGHRIGVALTGGDWDGDWYSASQRQVTVEAASVTAPFLTRSRPAYLAGQPGRAGVGGVVVVDAATVQSRSTQMQLPAPMTGPGS